MCPFVAFVILSLCWSQENSLIRIFILLVQCLVDLSNDGTIDHGAHPHFKILVWINILESCFHLLLVLHFILDFILMSILQGLD